MAWQLMRRRSGWVRLVLKLYFVVAPLVILLTGSRGAFVTGLIALSIVPLTLQWSSPRSVAGAFAVAIAIGVMTTQFVPESIWARLTRFREEISQRDALSLSGRVEIWRAGLSVAVENPVLGVGAGSYSAAIQSVVTRKTDVAHNTYLSVPQSWDCSGSSVRRAVVRVRVDYFPPPAEDRQLWMIVGFSWAVGVFSLSWEARKLTWLLFGLLAAQAGLRSDPAPDSRTRCRAGKARQAPSQA